jgi:hypothetical protein
MNTLILSGVSIDTSLPKVSVSPSAATLARRDTLLTAIAAVTSVSTDEEACRAAAVFRDVTAMCRQIEGDRVAVKEPFLQLGKAIDLAAKDATFHLVAEKDRVSRLLGEWEAAKATLRKEAERKRIAEELRLRQEHEDALAKADREAQNLAHLKAAEKAADSELLHKVAQVRQAAATVAPRAEGIRVRAKMEYQVDDVALLFQACPECVQLIPVRSEIQKRLNAGEELPGVTAWPEVKALAR